MHIESGTRGPYAAPMLRAIRHPDARAFLGRAEPWLLEREAEANIILAVAYLVEQGAKPFIEPAYFATVESQGRVVGCAMRPPPDGLYVTDFPPAAVATIAAQLKELFAAVPEVTGPEAVAVEFARCWSGQAWRVYGRHRRYVLDAVLPPQAAAGALRVGATSDLVVLEDWAVRYAAEIGSKVDTSAFFRIMVERGTLYLWDDGGPRSVVTASGFTPNGVRISAAYTPPEFRGRGYAGSAVAAVSRTMLETGRRFCVIDADADNPITNSIYRKIGYRPIEEHVLIHLD